MEDTKDGIMQNYFDAYKTRMMSLKGHNSACDTGDSFSWLLTSGCHDITQETVCSSIGLAAGPLWVIGHFLILTASGKKRTRNKTPPWITWSLLPHCLADVISCLGAILAMQYFPQIVFAFTVMFVHSTVAVVLLAYHLWCSTTKYDLHGEKLVRGGCSVSFCCFSPLKSCPLAVLAVVSFVTCDAQTTGEAVTMETVHLNDGELPLTWWEITGEIMGTIACVGHWLATGYDIIGIYRPSRHHRRQASGVFLMAVANMGYLVSVYGRSAGLTLHTLPWTLARFGLLGMNFGMLIQIARRTGRRHRHGNRDTDVDESLLSSSSGSDVSGSNVLWESTWKERLRSTMFQPEYPKPEFELDQPFQLVAVTRSTELGQLSALTPEARHHRVVQWVEKSSPDEEQLLVELLQLERRQHSGSFSHSQPRSVPSVPNSRKNSAIF